MFINFRVVAFFTIVQAVIRCSNGNPAQSQTQSTSKEANTRVLLSCDSGALEVTEQRHLPSVRQYTVREPAIVKHISELLDGITEGLDSSRFVPWNHSPFYMVQTWVDGRKTFLAMQAYALEPVPALLKEGSSQILQAGRGVPDALVGKIGVTAGIHARREGSGFKISFFRNEEPGIPGRYLGDWYFQECH